MKTREQKRNEDSEKVCREVRWQLSQYGLIGDWESFFKYFDTWMRHAKKNKYERPHNLKTIKTTPNTNNTIKTS